MILDSSSGNLIRKPDPKPSQRQNSRGENSGEKIILDSSASDPLDRLFTLCEQILNDLKLLGDLPANMLEVIGIRFMVHERFLRQLISLTASDMALELSPQELDCL
jgi:hypothetical protein